MTEELRIAGIVVGDRLREDLGDIGAMARSLQVFGLLQPIVVDAENRLIAGERRLRGAQSLGWEHITCTRLENLTERQRREIELEENLRRKDLTAYERSKFTVERVETAKAIAQEEAKTRSKPEQVSRPARGPVPQPASVRSIEQRTGAAAEESWLQRKLWTTDVRSAAECGYLGHLAQVARHGEAQVAKWRRMGGRPRNRSLAEIMANPVPPARSRAGARR